MSLFMAFRNPSLDLAQPINIRKSIFTYRDTLWWCGPTSKGIAIADTLQCGVHSWSRYSSAIGVTISPSKTSTVARHYHQWLLDKTLLARRTMIRAGMTASLPGIHNRLRNRLASCSYWGSLDVPSAVSYFTPLQRDDDRETSWNLSSVYAWVYICHVFFLLYSAGCSF